MKKTTFGIFKFLRVLAYLGICAFAGTMLFDYGTRFTSYLVFSSIFLIAGIVGLFLEIYKK